MADLKYYYTNLNMKYKRKENNAKEPNLSNPLYFVHSLDVTKLRSCALNTCKDKLVYLEDWNHKFVMKNMMEL